MSDLITITGELRTILLERTQLLNDRLLFELTEAEQLHYCRLNKKLMEKYWEHYEAAKKEGNYDAAALSFSQAFQLGLLKARTLIESKKNSRTVAEQLEHSDDPIRNFTLGLRYHLGLGVVESSVEALRWLDLAANQEHADAQLFLGRLYYAGYGVPKNRELAKHWLERSAIQGNVFAIYHLGNSIEFSKKEKEDNYKAAFVYYERAARLGQVNAQNNVGVSYKFGDGVAVNLKKAVPWLSMAAEQGDCRGQFNLADCYWFSKGIPEDKVKAVHWFRLSAEQGLDDAQYCLALAYYHGEGIAKDTSIAFKWFKKAAQSGHMQASYNLGVLYLNGDGVTKHLRRAVRWLVAAKKLGSKTALSTLEEIDEPMAKAALALLQGNHSVFLQLVLDHYEQVKWLYCKELSYLLKQKPEHLNHFYSFLSSISKDRNKNADNFLMDTLIILEFTAGMTELAIDISSCLPKMIENIDLANIPSNRISSFTHALLNKAYPDNTVLSKLWHRMQSCEIRMDSGLSRLFASQIVKNLFNDAYCLNCGDLTRDNLVQLVAAAEMEEKISPEELNTRFKKVLIIPSSQHPAALLLKVKNAILEIQKPLSLHLLQIVKLISDEQNGITERGWLDVLASVQEVSGSSLRANRHQSMFRAQMTLSEQALLALLRQPGTDALQDLISHRNSFSLSA